MSEYVCVYLTLRVLEVVPPEGTDLVLSSDVPHGERDVLVLDSLDVETCTRNASINHISLLLLPGSRNRENKVKVGQGHICQVVQTTFQ